MCSPALKPENDQTIVAEVRAAMPSMPARLLAPPIEQPTIAFLNLAGASRAAIAAEDRQLIGELFGRHVLVTVVPVPCDLLFLHCSFEPSGKVVGQDVSLRSQIRDCKARVAVVVSETPAEIEMSTNFGRL